MRLRNKPLFRKSCTRCPAAAVMLVAIALAAGAAAQVPAVKAPAVKAPVVKTPASDTPPTKVPAKSPPAAGAVAGELVYVPIYSAIYYEDGKRTLELAATLSIHNVNPDRPITIVRADYYNTDGKLIKKYIEQPLTLTALQTKNLIVEKADKSGGVGANFLVEWQAAPDASTPLIEAVMVNASSNLGIAFTTTGKVVRKTAGGK